jgi:dTDP-glucose pyrophosphorylase
MMKSVGIRQIFIVIGHLGYEVVRTLGNGSDLDVEIEYIEQTETLGIAHAVGRLEGKVQKPFLLCLGDIFFVSTKLQTMLDSFDHKQTRAVLASKIEERSEMIRRNFAIIPGPDGSVLRVIEKPRYIQNKLKGCGIYLFGLEVFDAIRRTPRTAMRDEYEITESIQILINDGHRVVHADIIEEDLNLTVPEDLLYINLLELQKAGVTNYCVDPALKPETLKGISQCIIGKSVQIESSVSLHNCVVFDDVKVTKETHLANAILTPDGVIQCQR